MSEPRRNGLHRHVSGGVGSTSVDGVISDEEAFDPVPFRIFYLGVNIHSSAALHLAAHLRIRIREKRSLQILLHHGPELVTRDLRCGDRWICRDDVPKIIAHDGFRSNRRAVAPAIGESPGLSLAPRQSRQAAGSPSAPRGRYLG